MPASGAPVLVVSDLHLGGRLGSDVLRIAANREPLLELVAGEGVTRVVLLGDALELRHGPVAEALAASRPFWEELGAALGPGGEIALVAGNHDHHLVAPWMERRRRGGEPPPLGLGERSTPPDGEAAGTLARWVEPAGLELAYPGVWVREDVYATHGHYLDRHITVPTFERLAAGVMSHVVGRLPEGADVPDDYEAALAPIYAWAHAVAQQVDSSLGSGSHGVSVRAWKLLAGSGGHAPVQRWVAAAAFPLVVGALNRARIGRLSTDISGPGLRRAGLRAMGEAAQRLGIEADHVIFGHTHRGGPFAGDEQGEWVAPNGARLWNCGNWVYEEQFLTSTPDESPYWPGTVILVPEAGPPELRRLLGDRGRAELAPGAREP